MKRKIIFTTTMTMICINLQGAGGSRSAVIDKQLDREMAKISNLTTQKPKGILQQTIGKKSATQTATPRTVDEPKSQLAAIKSQMSSTSDQTPISTSTAPKVTTFKDQETETTRSSSTQTEPVSQEEKWLRNSMTQTEPEVTIASKESRSDMQSAPRATWAKQLDDQSESKSTSVFQTIRNWLSEKTDNAEDDIAALLGSLDIEKLLNLEPYRLIQIAYNWFRIDDEDIRPLFNESEKSINDLTPTEKQIIHDHIRQTVRGKIQADKENINLDTNTDDLNKFENFIQSSTEADTKRIFKNGLSLIDFKKIYPNATDEDFNDLRRRVAYEHWIQAFSRVKKHQQTIKKLTTAFNFAQELIDQMQQNNVFLQRHDDSEKTSATQQVQHTHSLRPLNTNIMKEIEPLKPQMSARQWTEVLTGRYPNGMTKIQTRAEGIIHRAQNSTAKDVLQPLNPNTADKPKQPKRVRFV